MAKGLGMRVPAVYAACQMPCRFTRRVISCGARTGNEENMMKTFVDMSLESEKVNT